MPEDWVGWPLRKDYISPDFYELQDAYWNLIIINQILIRLNVADKPDFVD
jgi:hypothetical protein